MENPLKLTRLSLDLTQEGLAKKAGLSKSSVIRTEQGLYSSPPPQLLKALNMDYSKTLPLYTAFQTLHRASNNSRSANPYFTWQNFANLAQDPNPSNPYKNRHPFEVLLEGRSILDFCKAFCVTPNLVTRWVKKYWLVTSVPTLILDLFEETGYDGVLLIDSYDQFLYEKKVMLLTPQQRKEIREVQRRRFNPDQSTYGAITLHTGRYEEALKLYNAHVGGSEQAFIDGMNAEIKALYGGVAS